MGLFTTFYEAPTPNQIWMVNKQGVKVIKIKKHHEESWIELFIDLIYVGLFITLSLAFKDCSSKDGISSELLIAIATIILIMFTFRISIDSYSNRFLSDDFVGRVLYLVYGYGLAFIVLNTDGAEQSECHRLGMHTDGFIIGYMLCRLINLLIYATAMTTYPAVIPQYAFGFAVKCVVLIISFAMTAFRDGRPMFLLVSCVFEFLFLVPIKAIANKFVVTKIFRYPEDVTINQIPLNFAVYQRRLCMWIMMVLGESVIQFVEPDIDQVHPARAYWYFTAGLILIFTFSLLYCDSVIRENFELHAMSRSGGASGFWVWMHPVLGFSMFIVGVSIKLCISSVVDNVPVPNEYNFMLGCGCGCTLMFLLLMRGAHKGASVILRSGFSTKTLKRLGNYIGRILFALAHFIVAMQSRNEKDPKPNDRDDCRDFYLYIHAALSATSVLIELIAAQTPSASAKSSSIDLHSGHDDAEEGSEISDNIPDISRENPMNTIRSTEVELGERKDSYSCK